MLWDLFQANRSSKVVRPVTTHLPPRSDVLAFGHACLKHGGHSGSPWGPLCPLLTPPRPACKQVCVLPLHLAPGKPLKEQEACQREPVWLPRGALRTIMRT